MVNVKGRAYEYTVFFEGNENGGYTVTLPGLVIEGKELDDARRMAKDAIPCYIEGLRKARIPFEREIAQLKLSVVA